MRIKRKCVKNKGIGRYTLRTNAQDRNANTHTQTDITEICIRR